MKKYDYLVDDFKTMEELCLILREKRMKRGAIDFDFEEGEEVHTWRVNASNKDSRIELVLYCKREDMLLIKYEAPTGKKLHNRLWNGGNGWGEIKLYKKDGTLIDHVKMENTGCEYGEYC